MTDTVWKENTNGKIDEVYDATEEMGAPALVIAASPDWIRYPAEFGDKKLAGKKARVKTNETSDVTCPLCRVKAQRKVLTTEHDICVVACQHCGQYAWFRKDELKKLR